jgi:hypothetical protein
MWDTNPGAHRNQTLAEERHGLMAYEIYARFAPLTHSFNMVK